MRHQQPLTSWFPARTTLAGIVLLATLATSQANDLHLHLDDVAQILVHNHDHTLTFDTEDWSFSAGEAEISRSTFLGDVLFYTLTAGARVTAQITGVSGAASDFTNGAFDAIESIVIEVAKGNADGTTNATHELWVNNADTVTAEGPAAAGTVIDTSATTGRTSDADFGSGQGADVSYEVTVNVEDGAPFAASLFTVTFTAIAPN